MAKKGWMYRLWGNCGSKRIFENFGRCDEKENLKKLNKVEEGGKMGFGTKRKTTQTQTRRRIDKEIRHI